MGWLHDNGLKVCFNETQIHKFPQPILARNTEILPIPSEYFRIGEDARVDFV